MDNKDKVKWLLMLVTNALALIMLTLRSANIGLLWMDIVMALSLCFVDRALCHVVMYYVGC